VARYTISSRDNKTCSFSFTEKIDLYRQWGTLNKNEHRLVVKVSDKTERKRTGLLSSGTFHQKFKQREGKKRIEGPLTPTFTYQKCSGGYAFNIT